MAKKKYIVMAIKITEVEADNKEDAEDMGAELIYDQVCSTDYITKEVEWFE